MAISYLGYCRLSSSASAATITLNTTSLSNTTAPGGGTGVSSYTSKAGDFCVVMSGWSGTADGNPGVTSPTATEVADLYANDTNDTNMSLAYFFTGAGLTSITVSSVANVADGKMAIAAFFRGVDLVTPIDATTTTATGTGGSSINPPAITPTSTTSYVVVAGMSAKGGIAATSVTPSSGYTFISDGGIAGSTRAINGAMGYRTGLTANVSTDPGVFTLAGGGGAGASWAAATMALRAATGQIKVHNTSGGTWLAHPIKYWNGSSWVVKPLKRWNGSAWVKTTY